MKALARLRSTLALAVILTRIHAQPKSLTVTERELRAAAQQKVEPDYPAVAPIAR